MTRSGEMSINFECPNRIEDERYFYNRRMEGKSRGLLEGAGRAMRAEREESLAILRDRKSVLRDADHFVELNFLHQLK
jgi:hypothetical protein